MTKREAEAKVFTIERRRIEASRPEKVLFPADGITRRELAAYYEQVAHVMLPRITGEHP